MFRLDGKHAIVTGAGSGIGAAIALTFARQGALVAVLDIDAAAAATTVAAIEAEGFCALAGTVDVTDSDSMVRAFDAAESKFGPVEIVVNNAGIGHVGNVLTTTEADFDRLYAVNVKGVFLGCREAVKRMRPRRSGAILNLASIASVIGLADRFAYGMTKGAVLTMTMSVAVDFVKEGIRCNCVCPARVHTPFVDQYLAKNYPGREQEMFEKLSAYQPIGRMGRPDEIAALALYLCADESSFVTGQAYGIDGGVLCQ